MWLRWTSYNENLTTLLCEFGTKLVKLMGKYRLAKFVLSRVILLVKGCAVRVWYKII